MMANFHVPDYPILPLERAVKSDLQKATLSRPVILIVRMVFRRHPHLCPGLAFLAARGAVQFALPVGVIAVYLQSPRSPQ